MTKPVGARFVRQAATLASGTLLSQVIAVLAAPVLTRMYTPADFGVLAVFAAILSVTVVLSTLRYEAAIPIPSSDQEAHSILTLTLLCVIGSSLLALVAVPASENLANWLRTPGLEGCLWLLPFGVLLGGTYQALYYSALRNDKYSLMARTRFQQTGSMVVLQILGAPLGSVSLAGGQVAGQGAGVLTLGRATLRRPRSVHRPTAAQLREYAVKYRKFPLFESWSLIFNTISAQSAPLVVAILYGASTAGQYALAARIAMLPLTILGNSIGHVFHSRGAKAHQVGQLAQLTEQIVSSVTRIAMPLLVQFAILSPILFGRIFGIEWQEAGLIAALLTPWLLGALTSSPISAAFLITGRQAEGATYQAGLLIIRLTALVTGAYIGGIYWSTALFSIASFTTLVLINCRVCRIVGASFVTPLTCMARASVTSAIVAAPSLASLLLTDGGWWVLTGAMMGLAIFFCLIRRDLRELSA